MKKLFAILILLGLICNLVSCSKNIYDVRYAEDYLWKDGWEFDYGVSDYDSITKIIDSKEELDEIFEEFPDVDFEKEVIVYYSYVTTHPRKVKIDKAYVENNTLVIEIRKVRKIRIIPVADATAPQRRYLVFRLDKGDYENIEVKWA